MRAVRRRRAGLVRPAVLFVPHSLMRLLRISRQSWWQPAPESPEVCSLRTWGLLLVNGSRMRYPGRFFQQHSHPGREFLAGGLSARLMLVDDEPVSTETSTTATKHMRLNSKEDSLHPSRGGRWWNGTVTLEITASLRHARDAATGTSLGAGTTRPSGSAVLTMPVRHNFGCSRQSTGERSLHTRKLPSATLQRTPTHTLSQACSVSRQQLPAWWHPRERLVVKLHCVLPSARASP
jgi:hypothetical protein